MLSLYEKLGAGTSIAPSDDDFPIRKYKEFEGLSELESVIMKIIENEESKYKFAEEIRNNRKREEERQYEEYKQAIERMKAKRAAKQAAMASAVNPPVAIVWIYNFRLIN